jgi:arylsulfatase A-like enzyme
MLREIIFIRYYRFLISSNFYITKYNPILPNGFSKRCMMNKWIFHVLLFACSFCFIRLSSAKAQMNQTETKPNILFIVADDLGYADLGCFGGIIETPHIDKLAKEGIRFSRYHSAPLCAVARAMFLTGNDNHIAGMGVQGLQTGIEGYEGRLTNRVVTVADLLKDAGYHTAMAGKWHLGKAPQSNPHQKGFLQSFVVLDGAANHYSYAGGTGQCA